MPPGSLFAALWDYYALRSLHAAVLAMLTMPGQISSDTGRIPPGMFPIAARKAAGSGVGQGTKNVGFHFSPVNSG